MSEKTFYSAGKKCFFFPSRVAGHLAAGPLLGRRERAAGGGQRREVLRPARGHPDQQRRRLAEGLRGRHRGRRGQKRARGQLLRRRGLDQR